MSESSEKGTSPEEIDFHPEEESGEPEQKFDFAVVLAAGLRFNEASGRYVPDIDSQMRTLAAGTIAQEGNIGQLIFTGGKIFGPEAPSMAEAMKEYFLRKFPDLDLPILLEEKSFDTIENARFVKDLIGDEASILLITNQYHMLRAHRNFQKQGVEVVDSPAEEVVRRRLSRHGKDLNHEKFIQDYLRSCNVMKKRAVESVLRGILRVAPDALTRIAKVLRHGEAIEDGGKE